MTLATAAIMSPAAAGAAEPSARIRIDQVGYTAEQTKVAWLLAPQAHRGQRFQVVARDGTVAFSGKAGASTGRWNQEYRAVQPLDFSDLVTPGEYRIVVPGDPPSHSPWFPVASAWQLVDPLIGDVVAFFQAQRDGPDVIPGDLGRQPSHLNDSAAAVYAWPSYPDPDSDAIDGDLVPTGAHDRPRGWLVRRRRLHQVQPHHGVRRRPAVGGRARARCSGALEPRAGGPVRAGLAGEDMAPRHRGRRPPGRHRIGEHPGQLRRRP